ncbi:MAG: M23 family metallopeptidase [Holosporaceae bacterium]|jgi:murein DD-endopeptidase MepM/ murein hydrolase activator NlpD|nr:M23 family metallopeptidase [Holosporaceae bacterium]
MRSILYLGVALLLLVGCERDRFSPIDIKIDEDQGYSGIDGRGSGSIHRVSNGETLFDVALKYNIDPINLAKINGIKYPYIVKDGQILRLPEEGAASQEENKVPPIREVKKNDLDRDLGEKFSDVMNTEKKTVKPLKPSATATDQERVLSTPRITSGLASASKLKPLSASSKMNHPVDGEILSRFGDIKDGVSNDGINIGAPLGSPVRASAAGDVIYAGNKLAEFGNTIIIKHDNGLITSYAHLDSIKIQKGVHLNQGDTIGTVGMSGDVTEPQLHFEILKDKKPVNPSEYLKGE